MSAFKIYLGDDSYSTLKLGDTDFQVAEDALDFQTTNINPWYGGSITLHNGTVLTLSPINEDQDTECWEMSYTLSSGIETYSYWEMCNRYDGSYEFTQESYYATAYEMSTDLDLVEIRIYNNRYGLYGDDLESYDEPDVCKLCPRMVILRVIGGVWCYVDFTAAS